MISPYNVMVYKWLNCYLLMSMCSIVHNQQFFTVSGVYMLLVTCIIIIISISLMAKLLILDISLAIYSQRQLMSLKRKPSLNCLSASEKCERWTLHWIWWSKWLCLFECHCVVCNWMCILHIEIIFCRYSRLRVLWYVCKKFWCEHGRLSWVKESLWWSRFSA